MCVCKQRSSSVNTSTLSLIDGQGVAQVTAFRERVREKEREGDREGGKEKEGERERGR